GTVTFKEGSTVLASNVSVNASGQATFSTSTLTAGMHTITANYSGSGTLLPSSGTFSQTVNPAALTITADSKAKVSGSATPPLPPPYSGFDNGNPPASHTTQPTVSPTATAASHVAGSPYAITASGAVDSNYSISCVAGTLTVTPAALTITA